MNKRLFSWLRRAAFAALFLYAAALAFLYFKQNSLIYKPTSEWTGTPRDLKLDYEGVTLRAGDGTKLSAWFVRAPGSRGVVLFCHGNSRNMSSDLDVLQMFTRLGWSALIFDYRGYGQSEGKPSEEGLYRDADAAWKHLTEERKIPPSAILIWGRSLGAGVAAELALRHRAKGLVLEAAFTSLADVAAAQYPVFPVRLVLKSHFDNLKKIPEIGCPVLVVHSVEDTIIPIAHGKALFAAARKPKQFLQIRGPHKGLPWQPGYEEGLRAFLESLTPAAA